VLINKNLRIWTTSSLPLKELSALGILIPSLALALCLDGTARDDGGECTQCRESFGTTINGRGILFKEMGHSILSQGIVRCKMQG